MSIAFEELLEPVLSPVLRLLAAMLGSKSEVVVCRVTEERIFKIVFSENNTPEHSVGFIYNGLDLEALEDESCGVYGGLHSESGRFIKSYTVPIRSEQKLLGTVTVNMDVTDIVFAQNQFQELTGYIPKSGDGEFSDIGMLMDHLLDQAANAIGKPTAYMKKADKKEFIRYLDERGYFQIKKSTEKVAKFLDISKFTLYSCLEDIRAADYEKSNEQEAEK